MVTPRRCESGSRWIFCACRRFYLNLAIFATWKSLQHNYIDTKANCHLLKNWHVNGLCGRCLSVWGSPYTLYTYSILIHTGKGVRGGRVEPERRLESQQFTKLVLKSLQIPSYDWNVSPGYNSDKHRSQSPFTSKFFLWQPLLWFLYN